MPTTTWPGWPAPVALILAAIGAACFSAADANSVVAARCSGELPIFAAWVSTYPEVAPGPRAVALVPVLGVVDAPAVAFPPPLVKCTTRKTIRTTAMTDAAR